MKKQFAILGCGRFGSAMARELCELGNEVLVVDKDEDRINDIADEVTHALILDITDDEAVSELGLGNFDVVAVTMSNDLRSAVMAVVLAKEAGCKRVIAKASDALGAKILMKVGADQVVFPERDMAKRMAHRLAAKNILDFVELSDTYEFTDMVVPERWVGKDLRKLDLRARYGVNVVAVAAENGELDISPRPDLPLERGDRLILIAPKGRGAPHRQHLGLIEAAVVAGKAVLPSLLLFWDGEGEEQRVCWLRAFEPFFGGKGVAKSGRQKPVKPIKKQRTGRARSLQEVGSAAFAAQGGQLLAAYSAAQLPARLPNTTQPVLLTPPRVVWPMTAALPAISPAWYRPGMGLPSASSTSQRSFMMGPPEVIMT